MPDRSAFWSPPPAAGPLVETAALAVRLLPPVPQTMASGDPGRVLARFDLPAAAGLLEEVAGERHAVRLARTRMLVVGVAMTDETPGWCDGIALSSMTGALAVLEVAGPARFDLVARGTAIDPAWRSPSAALLFAGVPAILYRRADTLRLHVDSGLVAYMTTWITAQAL